ncbi:MAG: VWA domain-containing protein [Legionella sp.]|uniref:vWA domain-containing protein n=1 Tax=Legionella sp. TaxID=459 RepID=UPI0028404212|nr:VWA domain-containing protein [Legionella sp.]
MRSSSMRLFLSFIFCITCGLSTSVLAQENTEVVLLIDTSGSMKQNDPQNLRIPATNLLINLLKDRAKLTIFTFSTNTKLLVPTKEASDDYVNQFHAKEKQINSKGQFTNILAALKAANSSWKDSKSRFIVLLTDGQIDRGSKQQDSDDKQVLNNHLIPELKKNHIKLYTIGIGSNIDEELLKSLASQTNGSYQFINSMSDAEKSLYNTFTSAISAQGIPLEKADNNERKIPVDAHVKQLSVIIEKKDQKTPIALYQPDGSVLKSKLPELNKFIFIDVKHPAAGAWKIKGDAQQEERAIILTNLELITNKLSGEYFNRELITINARLKSEKGNNDLSPLLTNTAVTLNLKNEKDNFSTPIPLVKNMQFEKEILLDMSPGVTKSIVTAKNDSFVREEQGLFKIMPTPFQQSITNNAFKVELINPHIEQESVQIKLVNQERSALLTLAPNNGSWQTSIETLCNLQKLPTFSLQAEITAKSPSGRPLAFLLPQEKITCNAAPIQISSYIEPVPLNKIERSAPAPTVNKTKHMNKRHPLLSINLISMIGILVLILVSVICGYFYKKNQKLYKEKMDQLRGNDDI